ncbi:MAG: DNA-3-methyladenine glycosylase [Rhizobiaceae bacterium]|nr:DNA-3-methyladenine glycosylase [Rhizobiaceae bacterium]
MIGAERASFFARRALDIAPELVGASILVNGVGGVIVETEAYEADDAASHSFRGHTDRNRVMFGPSGHVYIYLSYGVHWCLNFVCQRGGAVLIRALEPTDGVDLMRERRRSVDIRKLCSGPGRLCQALAVDLSMNGLSLAEPPFQFCLGRHREEVSAGPRVGISKASELPWRFARTGSHYLSRRI